MRYSPEHKAAARARIVTAAGRAFRRAGYAGVGVDGLAKEAGVTSGAFYGHFKSKDAAFAEVALLGLAQLRDAIKTLQIEEGDEWGKAFIAFYLADRRVCSLEESCGLQSLTSDVMRSEPATRTAYESCLVEVVEAIASGLADVAPSERHQRAWALLSLLSGGVTIARSLASPELADHAASALRHAAMGLLA